MSRGQFMTIDVIFSFTVFLLVLQSFIMASNKIPESFSSSKQALEMERASFWSSEYIIKRGLCEEQNIISEDEVSRFSSLSYPDQKKELGIPTFEFELSFSNTTFGADPSLSEYSVVSFRPAVYEGNYTQIKLVVWK